MSRPLVREHRPGGFVLAVPLDGPAAVQEVLVRVVASERKEIAGLGHLLYADVAGSFGNQADVDIACRIIMKHDASILSFDFRFECQEF